jgi:pyruvate dehydrogenase E2 component (dihydrolipoamide acetyltransferase)
MDFLVPKLSATMETVKVLRWLKQAGDKVVMGEPLVELETDKATMEVESPVDGTLEAVLGAEGEDLSSLGSDFWARPHP